MVQFLKPLFLSGMNKMQYKKACLFLGGIILLIYFNTFRNGYALDDELVTGPQNYQTQHISNLKEILTEWYQNEMGNRYEYRPLVKISYAIENEIFGLEPGIHHFFNVLHYFLACLVLLVFLTDFFKGNFAFSLLAVLLFAIHPSHTEVVASLKNRDILLSWIFSFLAGIQLLRIQSNGEFSLTKWILVFVFFYLATLSKRDALIFVFVFPLLIILRNKTFLRHAFVSALFIVGAYLLLLLTMKVALSGEPEHRMLDFFENPLYADRCISNRILAAFNSAGFYLIQTVFPFRQVCYYGYNQIPLLESGTLYFFLGLIWVVGGMVTIFFFKRIPLHVKVGLVFFFGGMGLYLNFMRPVPGIVADRFAFVSSVGTSLLLTGLINYFFVLKPQSFSVWNNLKSSGKYFITCVFAIFIFLVVKRNNEWKDKETLFRTDCDNAPLSAKLHSLYALELIHQFRNAEVGGGTNPQEKISTAKEHLRQALAIYPDYANALSNLGYLLLLTREQLPEARKLLEHSIQLVPDNAEVYYNYSNILLLQRDFVQAQKALLRSIALKPNSPEAFRLLFQLGSESGDFKSVARIFSSALPLELRNDELLTMNGNLFARAGDTLAAVKCYDEAITFNPSNKNMGKFLVKYYLSKNDSLSAMRIRKLFGR